jgi:hypothetical protein
VVVLVILTTWRTRRPRLDLTVSAQWMAEHRTDPDDD